MTELRAAIRYDVHPLAGGREARITTRDPRAVAAIHQLLAFQRTDHHIPDR